MAEALAVWRVDSAIRPPSPLRAFGLVGYDYPRRYGTCIGGRGTLLRGYCVGGMVMAVAWQKVAVALD